MILAAPPPFFLLKPSRRVLNWAFSFFCFQLKALPNNYSYNNDSSTYSTSHGFCVVWEIKRGGPVDIQAMNDPMEKYVGCRSECVRSRSGKWVASRRVPQNAGFYVPEAYGRVQHSTIKHPFRSPQYSHAYCCKKPH